ncbi:MAG TPA: Hsp33 family molecular chaperone HslO [Myxococcaceae bacterium]|jgi:molecular chaperone Hsp33
MSDELFTALLPRSGLRVVAALTTEVSREARRLHRAEAGSSALLSEALTAVSLLAALQKERTRVSLQLECDGPVRGVFVDAEGGSLRGYAKKPGLAVLGDEGTFHWRPLLGNSGYLSVLRDLGDSECYRSSVELEAFELGHDLERYFAVSDQVETVVRIRTVPWRAEVLGAAGGVLLQKLPGGDAVALAEAGARLHPQLLDRALLEAGGSGPALLRALFPGAEVDVLAKRPLEFRCGCSRERVHRALLALGQAELEDLLATEGQAEATCEFCTTRYVIPADELRTLIGSVSPS